MRRSRLRLVITAGVLIVCCVALLSMPVESWPMGRIPVPPLDLVSGGPQVSPASRTWIDTDAGPMMVTGVTVPLVGLVDTAVIGRST